VAAGTFVAPFSRDRMTWVKPSFRWMMYRSGDASVHADHAAWRAAVAASPVRVQWDPERDAALQPLPYRAIQVGLSGSAVDRYVDEWIAGIEDVTPYVVRLRALTPEERAPLLPEERPYPVVAPHLGVG
jgi:hypothetical protein